MEYLKVPGRLSRIAGQNDGRTTRAVPAGAESDLTHSGPLMKAQTGSPKRMAGWFGLTAKSSITRHSQLP